MLTSSLDVELFTSHIIEEPNNSETNIQNEITEEEYSTQSFSLENEEKIAIYGSPSKSPENIVGYLEQNTSIEISRTESISGVEWAYIVGDSCGWVIRSQINAVESDMTANSIDQNISVDSNMQGVVIVNGLNIREGASRDSKVIGSYNKGDIVAIIEQQGDWVRTSKGWIMLEYVNIG